MTVRIFVEGAKGSGPRNIRPSLLMFLSKCLPASNLDTLTVTTCGGIAETVAMFSKALESKLDGLDDASLILLVDSDSYLPLEASRIEYLKHHLSLVDRGSANRLANYNLIEEQIYLMVQEMEAWFWADYVNLCRYYQITYGIVLPTKAEEGDIEQMKDPKKKLQTVAGRYHEVDDAHLILLYLEPERVKSLPHFRRFLEHLEKQLVLGSVALDEPASYMVQYALVLQVPDPPVVCWAAYLCGACDAPIKAMLEPFG